MFQVYNNILIFPIAKILEGYFPAGIFPCRNLSHGDFLCRVLILREIYSIAKYFFLHLFTFVLYMVWIQVSYCMLLVKQAGKLYFRFTWSQTKRQVFTLCCPCTCIHSKAAPVRATSLCHLFIHFATSLDPDQALHLGI